MSRRRSECTSGHRVQDRVVPPSPYLSRDRYRSFPPRRTQFVPGPRSSPTGSRGHLAPSRTGTIRGCSSRTVCNRVRLDQCTPDPIAPSQRCASAPGTDSPSSPTSPHLVMAASARKAIGPIATAQHDEPHAYSSCSMSVWSFPQPCRVPPRQRSLFVPSGPTQRITRRLERAKPAVAGQVHANVGRHE